MGSRKINYGMDAPKVIRNLLMIGIILLLITFLLPGNLPTPDIAAFIKSVAFFPGICMTLAGLWMILYARYGKFKQRDRILKLYSWKGDEMVLDVGTGLGLLMIGAAKKLDTGKSYGIDIFNTYDLSDNSIEQARLNTELENVSSKTTILKGSILRTDFPDNYFDVIISNLCLHNIYNKKEREQACREIYRIMKPEAIAIISDFKHTGDYRKVFNSLGMNTQKKGTFYLDTFPPLTIITAAKTTGQHS